MPVGKEEEPLLASGEQEQERAQEEQEVDPPIFRFGVVLGVVGIA